MTIPEKAPLDEVYLAHFGVKGMRWGVRNTSSTSTSTSKPIASRFSDRDKNIAKAALGTAAVGSILIASGAVRPSAVGGLVASGARYTGKLLLDAGGLVVKTTFNTTLKVAAAPFKLAGRGVAKGFTTVFGDGKPELSAADVKLSGRAKVSALLKRKPKIGSGDEAKAAKFMAKFRNGRTSKEALQLHPTTSIFGNRPPKAAKPPTQLYPTVPAWRQNRDSSS